MIAEPPLGPGVITRPSDRSPGVMAANVGASGVPLAVTVDWLEGAPAPMAFTARSRTSYVVPPTRPEMAIGLVVDAGLWVIQVSPPSSEYSTLVMALPPSEPRVKVTDTAPVSSATAEMAGAAGTDRGEPDTGADAGPAPLPFTARTSTSWLDPFASPPMVKGSTVEPVEIQAPPSSRYS